MASLHLCAEESYATVDWVTSLVNRQSGGAVLSSSTFSLDGNGNRVQEVREEPLAPTGLATETVPYIYNPQRNRLVTVGADSFVYDNEGQLANRSGVSFAFDFEHRLIFAGGRIWGSFAYDGVGNRLEAIRTGVVTTRYVYDAAGNLLAEADGNNTIQRYYIHGAGLLAMVTPAGASYSYHYDAVGSTVAMTDGSQTVVNRYAYTPYGRIVGKVEAVPQPFQYVGQYGVMAEPNGFYYMRARYYDPSVGRFISEDPIGFDGGLNLYAYVGGNPVNHTDPTGLFWFRQDWQEPGVVGRPDTLVPPRGAVSEFIEQNVLAGYTFGEMHDSFVGAATNAGIPDLLINIPSMIPMYAVAIGTEVLRTLGIINQPTPVAQSTTTRQPAPCK